MQHSRISVVGYVGQDAEIKVINGDQLATFSLGCTEKGRNGKADYTAWYKVSVWKGWADYAGGFKTGDNISVEGKFSPRPYTSKGGEERISLDITANFVAKIEKPLRDPDQASGGSYQGTREARQSQAELTPVAPMGDGSLEDIPF